MTPTEGGSILSDVTATQGGPRLVLMARLSEAIRWDDAVRRTEDDSWGYLRRKLEATEGPLREYKLELLKGAKVRLFDDLASSDLTPAVLQSHKEAFETLLPAGDYADLAFNLDSPPAARLEGARAVLAAAKAPTLFDHEAQPPERRSRAWEKRVQEMSGRLELPALTRIAERDALTPARKARLARRLRRNLAEYLSVTRGEGPMREDVTPFMLGRIETAVAATLRLLRRWN